MGLDRPLGVQYADFLGSLVRGDLGKSIINGRPIAPEVGRVLPCTLHLAVSSLLLGIILGVPLGIFTALRRNALADYLGRTLSLAGVSIPAFFLGILFMLVFSVHL